ncbi:hypothetical protein KQX54_008041 [Cotesia glomerata]|uniref:Uncharacterized protein n=1 Tax=Cotesia glomerata TaxID=32391 RepID=A0AAV7IIH2_COTGL|nr:hypothetical protein KQX54_008041 [Cotesia glomerata]
MVRERYVPCRLRSHKEGRLSYGNFLGTEHEAWGQVPRRRSWNLYLYSLSLGHHSLFLFSSQFLSWSYMFSSGLIPHEIQNDLFCKNTAIEDPMKVVVVLCTKLLSSYTPSSIFNSTTTTTSSSWSCSFSSLRGSSSSHGSCSWDGARKDADKDTPCS